MKRSLPFLLAAIIACTDESVAPPEKQPINNFRMELNNQAWTPNVLNECKQTYVCYLSWLDSEPFYTIDAYRNVDNPKSTDAENKFTIQIMNADRVGEYVINGTAYGHFQSFARYIVTDESGTKIYLNKLDGDSFRVNISSLSPIENSMLVAVTGSFSGTLYNKDNPDDFITVNKGSFVFNRTNGDFDHCN